ncbi:Initiator Replication protein [Piscirickettsia salmonis]|nr:Initiator Replication protein [Piscirickettsia salmonis]QGP64935.1 Initiator Replication protein [Piscirickettsia salmonis]
MGKAPGKKYYDWLENSLKRISYGKIDIRTTDGRNVFIDSFIHGFKRIDNIVSFQFSPHLIKLFEEGATQLPLQQRLSLNSDLDKWLYGYFNSHDDTKSKPVKVETLHAWSGSTLSLKHFKTKLKESIKRLNDQTNINLTFTDNKCTLVQCKKRKVSNLLTA